MTEEKSSDVLLVVANDLAEANALRHHLLETVPRLWLFVTRCDESKYAVRVSNEFGSRPSDPSVDDLKTRCQVFIDDNRITLPGEPVEELDDELVERLVT